MKLKILGSLAFAAATFGASASYAKQCGEISITEMDWASSAVVTAVAEFLMTQGYGCDVAKVPSSTVPALTSVAETGKPDIVTEAWVNSTPVYEELVAAGKLVEVADVLSDGGIEAWWIPDYLAAAHPELKTLEGIKANPDLVGGRFHDCPSGWACDIINFNNYKAANMESAGLERFQHGSGETLRTSIAAAYADKVPWFGYYWAPTSVLGKYPMVMVETAPYDADAHKCNGDANCDDPKLSAYPTAKVTTAIASAFVKSHPDIVEFLSKMSFTNQQMGSILAWKDDNNASNEEAAVYFITTYPDTWKNWLNADARSNLSALLN